MTDHLNTCPACGAALVLSPNSRSRKSSSLVCLNPACGKWRQPQGAIACDNSHFFARPNNTGGMETGDFVLRYGWMLDQIKSMPNSPEYTLSKLSPITIQKAVTHDKARLLGQHEEIVKTVDIAFETKREYDEIPETGAQLMRRHYMSKPKDLNAIAEIRS